MLCQWILNNENILALKIKITTASSKASIWMLGEISYLPEFNEAIFVSEMKS